MPPQEITVTQDETFTSRHRPVLGTLFGVVFLALAMRQRDIKLLRSSLGVFVVIAVAALAVYLTGKEAEDVVKPLPGVSQALTVISSRGL